MKICYIILTCEKYISTRTVWQLETMLVSVPREDIYYLGHKMVQDQRLFSWGAADDYNSLPYKFVDFFRNTHLDYDWFILIDDDTYVYHDRISTLLSTYSPTDSISIGHVLDHIQHTEWGLYLSGGAGTVLSRTTYNKICDFLSVKERHAEVHHWCADICLGLWLKSCGVQMIHNHQFHTDTYRPGIDLLEHSITFHHLKIREDYLFFTPLDFKKNYT